MRGGLILAGLLALAPLAQARGQAETVQLGTEEVPTEGTLAFKVRFPEELRPTSGAAGAPRYLVRSRLFDITIAEQSQVVGLKVRSYRRPPEAPVEIEIFLSRLKAEQWYHFVITWDTQPERFAIWLNGVRQEECRVEGMEVWKNGTPNRQGGVTLGAKDTGWKMAGARLLPHPIEARELPDELRAEAAEVPPLDGEGRTIFTEGLTADSPTTLLFADDFRHPRAVIPEEEGPTAPEDAWILEGNGTAAMADGALTITTNQPGERPRFDGEKITAPGGDHLVLWLNRRFPDNILVEYEVEPADTESGLHILFFAASHPDGGTIFPVGLKPRRGIFARYITSPGEFIGYHISLFGAPRGTANLRKDGSFALLAVGDDRIAGKPQQGYKVRLLKKGGAIQLEVDGRKVIDHVDDGKTYGPIHQDGYLGFRMMGYTRALTIRNLKVWKAEL